MGLAALLGALAYRPEGLDETVALGAAREEGGERRARGHRVCQDHALAARLDLPVAPRVAEQAVAPVAVEAPHEAAAGFVRVVVHVEAERERARSEEHTSELQSLAYLVCRLLLEKKKSLPIAASISRGS